MHDFYITKIEMRDTVIQTGGDEVCSWTVL
jgi:hypothetical protein